MIQKIRDFIERVAIRLGLKEEVVEEDTWFNPEHSWFPDADDSETCYSYWASKVKKDK